MDKKLELAVENLKQRIEHANMRGDVDLSFKLREELRSLEDPSSVKKTGPFSYEPNPKKLSKTPVRNSIEEIERLVRILAFCFVFFTIASVVAAIYWSAQVAYFQELVSGSRWNADDVFSGTVLVSIVIALAVALVSWFIVRRNE